MLDFERFIRACKQWPDSGPVREWGELLPTCLFEIDDETLTYNPLSIPRGELGRAQAAWTLWELLKGHRPRAFALILPVDLDSTHKRSPQLGRSMPETLTCLEAVLLQAWSAKEEVLLVGAYDHASDITWKDMSEGNGEVAGMLASPIAVAVEEWRESGWAA